MNFVTDEDRKIYREELRPGLPEKIYDAHVHVWTGDSFPPGFRFPEKDCCNRFGGTFTVSMWREIMRELLPEQQVKMNCFGTPHDLADRGVSPCPGENPGSVGVLVSPADSPDIVRERVERFGAKCIKPYWNYGAAWSGKSAADVEIRDMMTPEQLAYFNEAGLNVTLHIPRPGRFSDKVNQRQMLELCEKYPRVTFVFAHIGRAYFMRDILHSNLEEFAAHPNACFDTAMVNHEGVLRWTFDHFPAERVLFGTDTPIALLRGKSIEVNNRYAYLMGEDYRIGTAVYDSEHVLVFTTFFYEQLRAVLHTVPAGCAGKVFSENAEKIFNSPTPGGKRP